ncbi:MAG TPA: ATP synthase F1 subunit gamma [Candidatus Omnitrophota bacterium]|nr:ATP synthase F1 subunit gamma [Candidatus Omnitrophota bacterium]HPT38997.1 ATP synthase F1 subunit gamma [Candidatus Omnitrophota bacterium]
MASLKQIKNRIRSVENTKKVTGAMQMISVAKLNRIQNQLFILRPYALRLENLMYELAGSAGENSSGFFKKGPLQADIALCLFTSDSGLCGMYNQNVLRLAQEFLKKHDPKKIKLILVGQKGFNYFRSAPVEILNSYIGLNGKFDPDFCDKLIRQLSSLFLSGKVGSVYLAYTCFGNPLVQKATIEQVMNIQPRVVKPIEYIAEPDIKSILVDLIPCYLKIKMRLVLLEAFTSEHAARTVSMRTATDNAKELLEGLVLFRNKVRQTGITQDILEITSSAEALRG